MADTRTAHVIIKSDGAGGVNVQIAGNLTPTEMIAGLAIANAHVLKATVKEGSSQIEGQLRNMPNFNPRIVS